MKKFNVVSLSMDRNYMRNRLAFEMMDSLEIFKLFYSYSVVIINGKTEGIYDSRKTTGLNTENQGFISYCIIHRGFRHQIEKIKTDKKLKDL